MFRSGLVNAMPIDLIKPLTLFFEKIDALVGM